MHFAVFINHTSFLMGSMTIVQHTLVEKSVGLYREKSIDNACCTNLKSLQRITALLFYCLFLAQLLDIMILNSPCQVLSVGGDFPSGGP